MCSILCVTNDTHEVISVKGICAEAVGFLVLTTEPVN